MLDTKARELKGKAVASGPRPRLWCPSGAWVPELPCSHSETGDQELFTKEKPSLSCHSPDAKQMADCPTLDPRRVDSFLSVSAFWDCATEDFAKTKVTSEIETRRKGT